MDLEIATIKQAIKLVKAGISVADKAIKDAEGGDKKRKELFEVCKENYKYALGDLKIALKASKGAGSVDDVNVRLSGAVAYVDTCTDDLAPSEVKDFPLGPASEEMSKTLGNALSLWSNLKGASDEE